MTGSEVRGRRLALHLTQAALAEALGVSVTTIARWERGEQEIPPMLDLALGHLARTAETPGPVIPAGPFEQRLFLATMRHAFAPWLTLSAPLRASFGPYQGDGTWLLIVEDGRERPFDLLAMFSVPQVVGRAWLAADPRGEPAVMYSLPATEYGPAMSYDAGTYPDLTFPARP